MSIDRKLLIRKTWSGKVGPVEDGASQQAELARNVLQEAFNLWVGPEIERRKQAGQLPLSFVLIGAQVIFNLDANAPEIRLDEEVRAGARIKATRSFQQGDSIKTSEVEAIHEVLLTDLDPNAAHVTMIRIRDIWFIAFDFRYNALRASETHAASAEFLSCAEVAAEKGHRRAFVENLFGATELMAKAELLLLAEKQALTARSHGAISAKYNWWREKAAWIEPKHTDLLNRLTRLRTPARYLRGVVKLTPEEIRHMLTTAQELFNSLRDRIPKRFPRSQSS